MRNPGRTKYREGICPDFGRVRPVHLDELLSVERRMEVRGDSVLSTARLGWCGSPLSVPKAGEYLSLHHRHGKTMVMVERVSRSCVCCYTAVIFIHVTDVEAVHPQARVCECAEKREWKDSAAWHAAPGEGTCKRVGADSLTRISEAIKRKSRGQ